MAGSPAGWTVDRIASLKLLGAGGGIALGIVIVLLFGTSLLVSVVLVGVATALAGYMAPNLYLYQLGYDRNDKIQRALPDALDLLTISVESGLGFDAALSQVARNTDGPLASEFARVLQEMQIGMGRGAAMRALGERTHVVELKGFVSAMVQADALGIPIGQVLRVQSAEIRVKRRQHGRGAGTEGRREDHGAARLLHPALPVHRRPRPGGHRHHGRVRQASCRPMTRLAVSSRAYGLATVMGLALGVPERRHAADDHPAGRRGGDRRDRDGPGACARPTGCSSARRDGRPGHRDLAARRAGARPLPGRPRPPRRFRRRASPGCVTAVGFELAGITLVALVDRSRELWATEARLIGPWLLTAVAARRSRGLVQGSAGVRPKGPRGRVLRGRSPTAVPAADGRPPALVRAGQRLAGFPADDHREPVPSRRPSRASSSAPREGCSPRSATAHRPPRSRSSPVSAVGGDVPAGRGARSGRRRLPGTPDGATCLRLPAAHPVGR